MTAGRRRWLLAGVAAIVALLCLGGVALAGSLLSGPRAPLFEKNGPVAHASDVVQLAHVVDRTNSPTPADEQYGNPLEAKICTEAYTWVFSYLPPPLRGDAAYGVIFNCGYGPVTIGPPQKSEEGSPFYAVFELYPDASNHSCPVSGGGDYESFTLQPPGDPSGHDHCVIRINFVPYFDGDPLPPGVYSDTWTFPGDVASLTLHLIGTVPPP